MQREDHYGESFIGECPHCHSKDIERLPQTNLLEKWYCNNCEWLFGVRNFLKDLKRCNPTVLGCFYITPEERKENTERLMNDIVSQFIERLKTH